MSTSIATELTEATEACLPRLPLECSKTTLSLPTLFCAACKLSRCRSLHVQRRWACFSEACLSNVANIGDSSRAMAVLDLEPKHVSLDEPLRSHEFKMLKEVLSVEESGRASSPVAGLQTAQTQSDSLPSALASCEYTFPVQLQQAIEARQAQNVSSTAALVAATAPSLEDQPAAKRQQTVPAPAFEAESHPSMECALQSPFASAENIDHFLEDLPETSPAAQQLQQLQQYRQHSAPAPSTLSRALLESQSQELSLQHICSAEQAKARVSTLPTSKLLSCRGLQASLSPVVWRDFEAPHRVMVNLGLRCLETESNTGYPASMYAAFNPRVITTGMRHSIKNLSCISITTSMTGQTCNTVFTYMPFTYFRIAHALSSTSLNMLAFTSLGGRVQHTQNKYI